MESTFIETLIFLMNIVIFIHVRSKINEFHETLTWISKQRSNDKVDIDSRFTKIETKLKSQDHDSN